MFFVIRLVGAIGLCSGGVAFAIAHFVPAHRAKLNELGSSLVIASLALLGGAFAAI
jgi:hypothetical protein